MAVSADGHLPEVPRYDTLAYVSLPYPSSHPDPVSVVAHLAGLEISDPSRWRILELGCGDGGNLAAIAQAYPQTQCTGIDGNAAAIDRGRRLAADAGLSVALLHADITDLPDDLGQFDLVFLHGVWSWVPEAVRAAVPAAFARLLAPQGIAYVSYLALPGFHLLAPAREIALRAAAAEPDPDRAVAVAREAVQLTLKLAVPGVYTRMLEFELARWGTRPDYLIFHDILDPDAAAFALSDVCAALQPAGLTWLGEVRPEAWWPWMLDATQTALAAQAGGGDPAACQQIFDDAHGTSFKVSLFTRSEAAPPRDADPTRVLALRAATPRVAPAVAPMPGTAERAILAALTPLAEPVGELIARAGLPVMLGAETVLRLAAANLLTLHTLPGVWTPQVSDLPVASPLARAQAQRDSTVAALDHGAVTLADDLERTVLLMLDGAHDRPALIRGAMQAAEADVADGPTYMQRVDETVAMFARKGLLLG